MKRLFGIFLTIFMIVFSYAALAEPKTVNKVTTDYFSTVSSLSLWAEPDEAQEAWEDVKALLASIESAVSLSVESSDIARFNALSCGESCPVSDITAELILLAKEVYGDTNGLYDPTVFPLIDLWGFSPRFNSNHYAKQMDYDRDMENGTLPLPDEKYIQALLPLVNLNGIVLEERDGAWTLRKNTPDVVFEGVTYHAQLDLGGIAKGYACDQVTELLRQKGFSHGYFVCGGSSISVLQNINHEDGYVMTIGKPRNGGNADSHFASLRVMNTGLSTSNDQSHCFVKDGVLYCHIIHPKTGLPVNTPAEAGHQRGIASVTLLMESAAKADAMTTALMLMGEEGAEAYLREHSELKCLYVVCDQGKEYSIVAGSMDKEMAQITDDTYRWEE